MSSDSIGEDRPPGMSQLAPVSYLLLKVGKTTLCPWQYLLLLVFLSSIFFFFPRPAPPIFAPPLARSWCITSRSGNPQEYNWDPHPCPALQGRQGSRVAFQTHPRTQASSRGEAKDTALLLSIDAYLLEPTVCTKGSQASCGVWREDSGLDSRPCRKRRPFTSR